jgi:hypothetical protein
MGRYNGGGNGEADARSAGSAVSGFIGAKETLKDMGNVAFRYAYAGVSD